MYEVTGRGSGEGKSRRSESYGLKPMNCPGHCLLFKSQITPTATCQCAMRTSARCTQRSLRITDWFDACGRFHQDDGHIFSRPQQIRSESHLRWDSWICMKTFGLGPYRLVLSTRPEEDYIGIGDWDMRDCARLWIAPDVNGR
ncbi:Aminoacyl-tRNA synthetase class II [Penicillium cf. griseofulvum]|uniref:Aminoacyl-tRNA synthetase class II n=1 Tax=Penicillium cf. griseofulvum TaxID=2972120 RepID=A0A9W9J1T6_9EURO|nr:Aminoacyl-tRNA synthetase class II [Penicillium cf. griseofulvum]